MVDHERFILKPGDSLPAPRKVPHVWAYVGDTAGIILITFMPAGKMEAFFREVTKANAMPRQDHGMELLGPLLSVDEPTRPLAAKQKKLSDEGLINWDNEGEKNS